MSGRSSSLAVFLVCRYLFTAVTDVRIHTLGAISMITKRDFNFNFVDITWASDSRN